MRNQVAQPCCTTAASFDKPSPPAPCTHPQELADARPHARNVCGRIRPIAMGAGRRWAGDRSHLFATQSEAVRSHAQTHMHTCTRTRALGRQEPCDCHRSPTRALGANRAPCGRCGSPGSMPTFFRTAFSSPFIELVRSRSFGGTTCCRTNGVNLGARDPRWQRRFGL